MPAPIVLTSKTRGSWVTNPSDTSSTLINIFDIVTEALSEKGVKSKSSEKEFFNQISGNIINYFNAANFNKSAVIGAYYRSKKYNNLLALSNDDKKSITEVLNSVGVGAEQELFLNGFISSTPRDSHIAFLKHVLFKGIQSNLIENMKDKYEKPVNELIDAILTLVEFINTPFAVLNLEIENDTKSNSGIDLQWTSMQKAIETSLQNILSVKTAPSENMKARIAEVRRDLLKFQGAFGIANAKFEAENELAQLKKDYSDLLKKYQNVAYYVHNLLPNGPKEFNKDEDLRSYVTKYGEVWAAQYSQLEEQLRSKAPSTEKYENELKSKQEQLESKLKEITELKHEIEQLKVDNNVLQEYKKQIEDLDTLKKDNGSSLGFLSWISHILNTIKELTSINSKLNQENMLLKAENLELNRKNNQAVIVHDSSKKKIVEKKVADSNSIEGTFERLIGMFNNTFKNTNSTGIKQLMTFMTNLNKRDIPKVDKLCYLGARMHAISIERKDSSWSRSHFFGKGRQEKVQSLYDLWANEDFSLNNPEQAGVLISILETEQQTVYNPT